MSEAGGTGGSRARRRKRNIRRKARVESGDEGEEDEKKTKQEEEQEQVVAEAAEAAHAGPPRVVSRHQHRGQSMAVGSRSGGAGLLSFADEEEAEGKASKLKKRRKQRSQGGDGGGTTSRNHLQFHFSPDGQITETQLSSQLCSTGEYTAEKLRRLREANRFNAKTLSEVELKGSFKPSEKTQGGGVGRAMEASTSGRAFDYEHDHQKGDLGKREEGGEGGFSSIPSKAEIEAIKEDREKWRQLHATAATTTDSRAFIPLSSGKKGGGCESSDDDQDDADHNKTRKFGVPLADSSSLKYVRGRSHFVQDEEDGLKQNKPVQKNGNISYGELQQAGGKVWSGDIDAQAREAMANMAKALDEMKNRDYIGERELSALRDKMQSAKEKGANAEERLELLAERYQFLQEMKQYFSDFCECLGEKAPIVEEVEEQMEEVQQEMGKVQLEQLKRLHKLQFSALQAGVLCAMTLGNLPDFTSKIPDDIQQKVSEVVSQTEERLKSEHKDSIGALGGSPLLLPLNAWDSRFKGRLTQDFLAEEDRYLSYYDQSLTEKLDKLREYSYTVFSDTDETFCSFDLIKQKLEHFKLRQREAYFQAYVSESLPQLFSPLVRLELLKWDPLLEGGSRSPSIEEMEWYKCLYSYGMVGEDNTLQNGDADDALVPTLVEKVLLPKVKFLIVERWDVTNVRESRAIRGLVEELFVYLDGENEDLQELLLIVKNKVHSELDQANIPMWPQKAARCVPMAQAYTAYAMKRALKMFEGTLLWEGLLDHKLLVTLAIQEIFQKRLFSYLKTIKDDTNTLALILLHLCKSVPRSWIRDCKEDLAGLGSFMRECMGDWKNNVDQTHLNGIKHFVDGLQRS